MTFKLVVIFFIIKYFNKYLFEFLILLKNK
jgi:hypothetical protein